MIGTKNGTWGELSKSIQIFPLARAVGHLSIFAGLWPGVNAWIEVLEFMAEFNGRFTWGV